MNCSTVLEWLDDWLDGEVSAERGAGIEHHLGACESCRRAADETRALLRAAADLPASIAPSRDLLPGIRAAAGGSPATSSRRRITRASAVAAAALVGLAVAAWALRPAPGAPAPVPVDAAIQRYLDATAALVAALERETGPVTPEARQALVRSLSVVDRAISDVEARLGSGPRDDQGEFLLAALYQQKARLLQKAARLSARLG